MFEFLRGRKEDPREALRAVVGDYVLPSFSAVAVKALEKVRDDRAPVSELAEIIAADPGVTVQLLKMVNSAAYSLRSRVSNVGHAISLLGRNQVESVLLAVAVGETLPDQAAPGFDAPRFWRAAARRATTARTLARRMHPATEAETFTAALLQDMAVPILAIHRSEYGEVLEQWHEGERDLADLERERFGWDHAEVATWLCDAWAFPDSLTRAIGTHHTDTGTNGMAAAGLVACLREGDENPGVEELIEGVRQRCGLETDEVRRIVNESFESASEIARLFA